MALLRACRARAGTAAVCAYLLWFALPLRTDHASLLLAIGAAVALLAPRSPDESPARAPFGFARMLIPAIALFCLATAVSTVLALDVARSLAAGAAMVPALLVFVLVAFHGGAPGQVRALLGALCVVVLLLAVALIAVAIGHGGRAPIAWIVQLGSPILVVPNDAAFFALAIPFALLPLHRLVEERGTGLPRSDARPGWPRRWARCEIALGVATVAAAVTASVVLQSRTAVLTALVCVVALAWLWRSRALLALAGGGALLALLVDRVALHGQLAAKFAALLDARLALWWSAWRMFLDRPLVGQGPNNFGPLYLGYLADLDVTGRLPVDARVIPWAHNVYVELLAERGVPGFLAFGAMFAAGALVAWRLRARHGGDGPQDRERRRVATVVLASMAGLAFAGLVELTLMRLWVLIVLFTLLGIVHALAARPRHPTDSNRSPRAEQGRLARR